MSLQIAIFLVIVFASVAIAIGSAASLVFRWSAPEHREIRKLASQRNLDGLFTNTELTEAVAPWVKRFKQVAPKSPKELSKLRRRLGTAGYRSMTAAVLYGASEVILPIVFAAASLLIIGFAKWYIALFAAAIGWVLPSFWLGRQTGLRQKQIRNGLPDALDLMIVCIESGSGIDQALVKTSDELDISYPPWRTSYGWSQPRSALASPGSKRSRISLHERRWMKSGRSWRCSCRPTASARASLRRYARTQRCREPNVVRTPRSARQRSA
jgi:Flp pilus assembly protein TadB